MKVLYAYYFDNDNDNDIYYFDDNKYYNIPILSYTKYVFVNNI